MFSRVIHVVAGSSASFLSWLPDTPDLLMFSPADGHWGCFHLLAIVNNNDLPCEHSYTVFARTQSISGRYLGSGLLGHCQTVFQSDFPNVTILPALHFKSPGYLILLGSQGFHGSYRFVKDLLSHLIRSSLVDQTFIKEMHLSVMTNACLIHSEFSFDFSKVT